MAASVQGETNGRHLALGHAHHWSASSPQASARLIRAASLVDRFRAARHDNDLRYAALRNDILERFSRRGGEGHGRWGRGITPGAGTPVLPGGAPTNPIPEPSSVILFALGGALVIGTIARKTGTA